MPEELDGRKDGAAPTSLDLMRLRAKRVEARRLNDGAWRLTLYATQNMLAADPLASWARCAFLLDGEAGCRFSLDVYADLIYFQTKDGFSVCVRTTSTGKNDTIVYLEVVEDEAKGKQETRESGRAS